MKNSMLVAIVILCSVLAGGSSRPVQDDAVISAFLMVFILYRKRRKYTRFRKEVV